MRNPKHTNRRQETQKETQGRSRGTSHKMNWQGVQGEQRLNTDTSEGISNRWGGRRTGEVTKGNTKGKAQREKYGGELKRHTRAWSQNITHKLPNDASCMTGLLQVFLWRLWVTHISCFININNTLIYRYAGLCIACDMYNPAAKPNHTLL